MVDKKENKDDVKEIGITVKKSEDFSEWYQQAIIKSEFTDYSAVSGCIVYRPEGYAVWEKLVDIVKEKLKKSGVKNTYFPLLIPEKLLMKEATHLKGFNPEVAWVTHAGDNLLDEKLAIRPTSETIMYDSYAKWIRSWRDLPLRIAQWNNVIRWEFKHPVPILRSREFLWVEGHTVFATKKEAEDEIREILSIWEDVLENYMAIAFFTGKKSKKETFAGAEYTVSLESVLPNGKAIQGPDAHYDGQIFAKAYDINFLNKNGESEFAFQNTWAITTRMLGVMFGIHGDDKGFVLPPKLAPIQVVIVPIIFDDSKDKVLERCREIKKHLEDNGIDAHIDDSDYKAGWKFNKWELKGIPVRIEFGPKDLANEQCVVVRRDKEGDAKKETVKLTALTHKIKILLDDIQKNLYIKSKEILDLAIVEAKTIEEFTKAVENSKIALVPFCNNPECEEQIKEKTCAKSLNAPLDQKYVKGELKCISCGADTDKKFFFGKSY